MRPPPSPFAIVVACLLALGVYFRVAHLDRKVYWHDEAFTSLWISGHSSADLERALWQHVVRVEALQPFKHVNPRAGVRGVVAALAVTEPHQTPGYALLAWLWACTFGDSVVALRSLSVVLSLLAFPLLFWLCRELFDAAPVAWLALALLAVSPFNVIYAQEARDYSLWTVAILLSSALLLRALRRRTGLDWSLYAIALALGLYTHLLFTLVALAHFLYVLGDAGWRLTPRVRAYLLAASAGVLPFTPWLLDLWRHREALYAQTAWGSSPSDLLPWIKTVVLNVSCVFFDARMRDDNALYYLTVPIVLAIAASFWCVLRTTPRRTWWFLFTLVGTTPLALGLPDLFLGGRRFIVLRYGVPCYIGILLAMAYWLATRLGTTAAGARRRWRAVTAALLAAGIATCVVFYADTWWHKSIGRYDWLVARALRASPGALVISHGAGAALTLSYAIDSRISLLVVPDGTRAQIPVGRFGDVYALCPSEPLWELLHTAGTWERIPTPPGCHHGELWHLTARATSQASLDLAKILAPRRKDAKSDMDFEDLRACSQDHCQCGRTISE